MRRTYYIVFVALFLTLISCKHDKAGTDCQHNTYYLDSFCKQFAFKQGSFWVYTCSTNPNIDTMKVSVSVPRWINYPAPTRPGEGGDWNCSKFECLEVDIKHMSFIGNSFFDFSPTYNHVLLSPDDYADSRPRVLLSNHVGDSMAISTTFHIKLENKIDTLTILGTKYNNIFQMSYSPNWKNFKRIWWCPGVGFVRFEFINPLNQVETWDLQSHHVVF